MSYLPFEVTRSALESELARQPDVIDARYDAELVIREVRENGFARVDGSVVPGPRAIAAPILDLQGDLRACMALVSPPESLVEFPTLSSMTFWRPRRRHRAGSVGRGRLNEFDNLLSRMEYIVC